MQALALSKDLARIEDGVGVERCLELAHEIDAGLARRGFEPRSLGEADAVFAGDGAAELERLLEDLVEGAMDALHLLLVALVDLGEGARSGVPAIVDLLDDSEWRIRRATARALGILDTQGVAMEALGACFGDEFKDVRLAAQAALIKRGKLAEAVLEELLRHDEAVVRELAAEALRRL